MEILLVNKAISILVNHVESFLELLDLGLIKHSEYIGSRPLGTLLGSLRLGLFAGHGGGMKGACKPHTFMSKKGLVLISPPVFI